MIEPDHGRANEGQVRWVKLFAVLLGLLLWWPLVPNTATFAQALHVASTRADVDRGAVGWSEPTPLEASELLEAEDSEGEDTSLDPACTRAPARVLERGWAHVELDEHECPCVLAGHDRLERQRGPPIA